MCREDHLSSEWYNKFLIVLIPYADERTLKHRFKIWEKAHLVWWIALFKAINHNFKVCVCASYIDVCTFHFLLLIIWLCNVVILKICFLTHVLAVKSSCIQNSYYFLFNHCKVYLRHSLIMTWIAYLERIVLILFINAFVILWSSLFCMLEHFALSCL